jgi:hypothetical protein
MRKEIHASLTDIHEAAIGGGLGTAGSPNTMTMYRFAAFLSVLAGKSADRDAESAKQAAINLKLQNDMIRLTRWFLAVSIVLSFAQIVAPYLKRNPIDPPRQINQPTEQAKAGPLNNPIQGPTPH